MGDLIEALNDAWRRLYADGDEHGVCDTLAKAAAALEAAREDAAKQDQLLEALVEKWRRYSDGNFDDAANARSSCADLLERLIKGSGNA